MDLSQFHFAHPLWLWIGIVIPLVFGLYFFFYKKSSPSHQLEKFIDKHLLPYLLVKSPGKKSSIWKSLLLWSVVWTSLTLAIAGPRWNFREIETFHRDQSLVILLDLSQSMDSKDIKPSRLVRARQKIEDLINLARGIKIGLIAFAADPHMITPLTDDVVTIRHLLPSLETDLIYVQGSRLSPALTMASRLLDAEPGNNKAIVVISDGGFEDASAITTARNLAEKGIVIHTMGVGTTEGAPVQDRKGNFIKKDGSLVLSKLEKDKLHEISNVGKGQYLESDFTDYSETVVLTELEKRAEAQRNIKKKVRFWEEHFYLLIFPLMPILLLWFRKGHVFPIFLFLLTTTFELDAFEMQDYFKNSEEIGKQALDNHDYKTAIEKLQDPYRKGVAHYRAGNFAEAEKLFRQSSRPEIASNAAYNLGNALVQQQKLDKAVTAYEEVLKQWPDHTKARDNLEIVKKMLEQKNEDNQQSDESNQQDQKNDNDQSESKKENHDQNQDSNEADQQEQDGDSPDEGQQGEENQNAEPQSNESQNDENEPSQQEEEEQAMPANEEPSNEQNDREAKAPKSQEDQDADQWLNRLTNEPKQFLKNKFQIESKRNGTKETVEPW